jgi:pyruvate dehydrogenase E2 component (dihydrolipoamide acetyltransferase)
MVIRVLDMPRLGETMEEGHIVNWLVKAGDRFRRGDVLLEIETDKTVVEYPALGEGRLEEVLAVEGEMLAVGAPLARLDIPDGADWPEAADEKPAMESVGAAAGPSRVVDLAMPRLGETMEEGRIVRWMKEAGETFRRGEAIIEIETDKTVAEYPALSDGKLVEILRRQEEVVGIGEPIARIEVAVGEAARAGDRVSNPGARTIASATGEQRPAPAPRPGGPVRATPLARRIARQNAIDLAPIRGSGRRARIEKADVLAVLARGGSAAAAETAAADDDLSFLDLPEGRLAYVAKGPTNGPVTVLLHGFAADHTVWAALAAGLARAGQRVIAPDLAAHGATTIPAASVSALSAGLAELLRHAAEGRPVRLVAHSLGAVAAVNLARAGEARIGSLVLVAPAGIGHEIDRDFIHGMATATAPGEIAHLLRRLSRDLALSPAAIERIAAQMKERHLIALAEDAVGSTGQQVDILPDLAALSGRMPVRVVVGVEDRIIPWRQVTALPPSVAIHLMGRSGHMAQWDQTRDLLDILGAMERGT